MVTERHAHILDDDRWVNATRFQEEFYGGGDTASEETVVSSNMTSDTQPAPTPDLLQSLEAAAKQQLLLKLPVESPDMTALLTTSAGRTA